MKNIGLKEYLLTMIFIAIIIFSCILSIQLADINDSIKKRTVMDSLYIDHLINCSMIRKDQIGIDQKGYIYSTYHKNPNKLNHESK